MARAMVAALLLALAACAHAQTYVLDTQQPQKSVPYNVVFNGFQGEAEVIPFEDPLVAPPANLGPFTPWSIHVTLAEGDKTGSVWISWSTGKPTLPVNPAQINQSAPGANRYIDDYPQPPAFNYSALLKYPDPASVASQVQWGLLPGAYLTTAVGTARAYDQVYFFSGPSAVSQLFHHVHVTGIPYGKKIYYKVGDPSKELSGEFTLTLNASMQPYSGVYPIRVGVVADVGVTYNSSVTYEHLVGHNPDFTIFMGDLSYSDTYTATGSRTPARLPEYALSGVNQFQTFQPHWDTMTQLLQNKGNGASLPYLFLPGNHEIERDEQLNTFQSYQNRFRAPWEQSLSTSPLYYSLDVGPIHLIMLNAYGPVPNTTINTNQTSQQAAAQRGNAGYPMYPNGNYPFATFGYNQFSWFLNDIGRVDRAKTPWVIVAWHQPPYNSYQVHYKEFECGRLEIEPYLYANGVDLVYHGHIHAYERTYPINNYARDQCGPRWLTMGDGGNVEGLYKTFAAEVGTCFCTPVNNNTYSNGCPCADVPASTRSTPSACATYQEVNANGTPRFAPFNGTQPSYSAYREPSFGHGILEILSDTEAQWTWYRNQDSNAVPSDTALFTRNTAACPNKLRPNYTPGAPTAKPLPLPDKTHSVDVHGGLIPSLPPTIAKNLQNASTAITTQIDQVVNKVQGAP